jgi:hypothetical protein
MRKVLLKAAVCITCMIITVMPVLAAEPTSEVSFTMDAQSVSGQVITLSEDAKAYTSADESTDVAESFSKGDTVYVVEEANGWYQIFYKGENLYIPVSSITSENVQESQKQAEELAKDVDEELKAAEKNDVAEIEAFWRQRRSQRNALIWKIVIAILVVAILVVSVVTGVKNSKAEADKEKT